MKFSTSFEFSGFKENRKTTDQVNGDDFDKSFEVGPIGGQLEVEMSVEEYIQLISTNKELGMEILSIAKEGLKTFFELKKQKLLGRD